MLRMQKTEIDDSHSDYHSLQYGDWRNPPLTLSLPVTCIWLSNISTVYNDMLVAKGLNCNFCGIPTPQRHLRVDKVLLGNLFIFRCIDKDFVLIHKYNNQNQTNICDSLKH